LTDELNLVYHTYLTTIKSCYSVDLSSN